MTTEAAIIAAIILPIPFFHLWLHALLPLWRRRPFGLYLFGLALWIAAFKLTPILDLASPIAFMPGDGWRTFGTILVIIGFAFAAWSLLTLGPLRFFVWAVLRPGAASKIRITSGPFSFLAHPAYIGYLIVAVGNLISSGKLYLVGIFALLMLLTPVVIWLEEHELGERLETP